MLDPKILRDDPEKIRNMLKARGIEFDLDGLIVADKKRRDLIIKTDELRKKRNEFSIEFGKKQKASENTTDLVNKMAISLQELEKFEKDQVKAKSNYDKLASTIPNLIHESVPSGADATSNEEIRKWGIIPKFDFQIQDHIDLSNSLDIIDLERAAKVSGARFYYLKNDLVKVNQALINFAIDFLSEKNYHLVQPPYMIKREPMEGCDL